MSERDRRNRGRAHGAANGVLTVVPSRRNSGEMADLLSAAAREPTVVRRVVVDRADVAFVKGVLEASRGLATLVAVAGGELHLVTTREQEADLDELLTDLGGETSLRRLDSVDDGATSPSVPEQRDG